MPGGCRDAQRIGLSHPSERTARAGWSCPAKYPRRKRQHRASPPSSKAEVAAIRPGIDSQESPGGLDGSALSQRLLPGRHPRTWRGRGATEFRRASLPWEFRPGSVHAGRSVRPGRPSGITPGPATAPGRSPAPPAPRHPAGPHRRSAARRSAPPPACHAARYGRGCPRRARAAGSTCR